MYNIKSVVEKIAGGYQVKQIGIGIVGFGSMGKTHSYVIENLKYFYNPLGFDARVVSVATAHVETARAAADLIGCEPASSLDEIIARPDVDVVDICTPNIYHYDMLKKAIAAKKHIYCEKPLCITPEQADEVAELAERAGIRAQVVFHNRFFPAMQRAKQLVDEGRLGRILSFRCCYRHSSATDPDKNAGWKQNRDICGGGVLFDLGSHALDLVYYLCGEYRSVVGRGQIAYPVRRGMDGCEWQTNADEAFYIIAELECGAVGTVEASKIAVGTNDDLVLEVFGEHGALRFDLMEPNWLYFYDGRREGGDLGGERGFTRIECVGRTPAPGGVFPSVKAPVGWLRGHVGSYYAFLSAVAEGRDCMPSFRDAAHIQRVMDEAYRSAGMQCAGGK